MYFWEWQIKYLKKLLSFSEWAFTIYWRNQNGKGTWDCRQFFGFYSCRKNFFSWRIRWLFKTFEKQVSTPTYNWFQSLEPIVINSWNDKLDKLQVKYFLKKQVYQACPIDIGNFFTHVLIYLLPGICIYFLEHLEDFCWIRFSSLKVKGSEI